MGMKGDAEEYRLDLINEQLERIVSLLEQGASGLVWQPFNGWRVGRAWGYFVTVWPPSANRLLRVPTKGPLRGRILLSKEARQFKEEARKMNRFAGLMEADAETVEPVTGPVAVRMFASPPDNRKRDLDNVIKIVLDSMKGILFADDSQIVGLLIERSGTAKGEGCILAEVYEAIKVAD